MLAVVSALLGKNPDNIKVIKNNVGLPLRKLIDCYTGKISGICLDDGNVDYYIMMLKEFILLENGKHIDSWLRLKDNFRSDLSFILGEYLSNAAVYDKALEQFYDAMDSGYPNKKELYFMIGFCLFKTNKYDKSAEFLKKALEAGYQDHDAYEFLRWIEEKVRHKKDEVFKPHP